MHSTCHCRRWLCAPKSLNKRAHHVTKSNQNASVSLQLFHFRSSALDICHWQNVFDSELSTCQISDTMLIFGIHILLLTDMNDTSDPILEIYPPFALQTKQTNWIQWNPKSSQKMGLVIGISVSTLDLYYLMCLFVPWVSEKVWVFSVLLLMSQIKQLKAWVGCSKGGWTNLTNPSSNVASMQRYKWAKTTFNFSMSFSKMGSGLSQSHSHSLIVS